MRWKKGGGGKDSLKQGREIPARNSGVRGVQGRKKQNSHKKSSKNWRKAHIIQKKE